MQGEFKRQFGDEWNAAYDEVQKVNNRFVSDIAKMLTLSFMLCITFIFVRVTTIESQEWKLSGRPADPNAKK